MKRWLSVLTLVVAGPALAAETVLFIPAAAHAPGREGTVWATELRLFNPGAAPLAVGIRLLDSRAGAEVRVDVGARRSVVLPDVVAKTLKADGGGGLLLRADGPFVATSRTSNDAGGGSVGVAISGVDATAAVTKGLVPHLSSVGKRSNLAFLNVRDAAAAVRYTLRDGDTGAALGEGGADLGPYGFLQVNDVFGTLGARSTANAVAEVTSATPILAFATVVESVSGDGSFFLAKPDAVPANPSGETWKSFFTLPKGRGLKWQVESGLRAVNLGGPSRIIVLADGRYRLFYNSPGGLKSATSADGRDFTPDPGSRLPNGDPAVIYLADGGYRFLWPEGPIGSQVLKSATSTDGLSFTLENGDRYRPAPQDAGIVQVPHAVKLADGRWRLYYVGDWTGAGGSANVNNTRSAVSSDEGLTWTAEKGSELTAAQTIDPDVVHLEEGGFRLYFKVFQDFRAVDADASGTFASFAGATRVLDASERVDPTLIRLPDGTIRMFFGVPGGIGSAVATD